MIRGLYTSAAAMTPAMRAQEILANNLANAATGGFRQDRLAFHRIAGGEPAAGPPGAAGAASAPGASGPDAPSARPELIERVDLSPGSTEATGSRFHLAVSGPGFFVVQGPEGELYTRDGTTQLGPDGSLLHRSGYPLLTEGGGVTVPPGAEFAVGSDGMVYIDGAPAGKLRLAALSDPTGLRHAGAGLLQSGTPAESDTTSRVLQGSLEGANVDPVLTMVDMMTLLRGFEANQKAILAQDGSLGRLIQWAAA
jgi:flagellar basal body rod protein FlgG